MIQQLKPAPDNERRVGGRGYGQSICGQYVTPNPVLRFSISCVSGAAERFMPDLDGSCSGSQPAGRHLASITKNLCSGKGASSFGAYSQACSVLSEWNTTCSKCFE